MLRVEQRDKITIGKGGVGDTVEGTMSEELYLAGDEGEAQSGEKICAWKTPLGHFDAGWYAFCTILGYMARS